MTKRRWAQLLSALMILCGVTGLLTLPSEAKGPGVAYEYGLKPDGSIVGLNDASKAKVAAMQSKAAGTCTWKPDGKCYWYTGGQFDHRSICFENALGTYWNYQQAQLGFQSGQNTVLFFNHGQNSGGNGDCIDGAWDPVNILYYQAYNGTDGLCAKLSNHVGGLGLYDQESFISMNANPPSGCIDTVQHRNRNVSRIIGIALGLALFQSSANLTASIMNTYFGAYNWPGTDDRNALYWLYYGFY